MEKKEELLMSASPPPSAPPPYEPGTYGQPEAPGVHGYPEAPGVHDALVVTQQPLAPVHPHPDNDPNNPGHQGPSQSHGHNTGHSVNVVINNNNMNARKDWENGLLCCFMDPINCLFGLLCAPCQMCCNCLRIDANCCSCCLMCTFCPCFVGGYLRGQARYRYRIRGGALSDCCAGFFCLPCVNCQMATEISKNG